jgi:CBS domain-containing protein
MENHSQPSKSISSSLVNGLVEQLMTVVPFSEMDKESVELFIKNCDEQYYEPNEIIIEPNAGVPQCLYLIRQGSVSGKRDQQHGESIYFELDAGEMFSIGSVLTSRPVSTVYRSIGDTFCLQFPVKKLTDFGIQSPRFIDYLKGSFQTILHKSQEDLRQHFAAKAAETQLHQNTLESLVTREPVSVLPQTTLREALITMDEMRIGSILVIDESKRLQGILTRHDLLKRVVLAEKDLSVAISEVMTSDIKTLEASDTVEMAGHLMMQASIRHLPIVKDAQVVGLISERDLFSFQRFSVSNISAAIHGAKNIQALVRAAEHIRQYSKNLLSQGVTGNRLTSLVSYLNDLLTSRLITMTATEFNIEADQFCWLALGSEGREEQTISTDQDNALILADGVSDAAMQHYLHFARQVNEGLDQCGFPLCKGNVMASNPKYSRRQTDWIKRCAGWIEAGSPQDLLDASIFFDFRPISGNASLALGVSDYVSMAAAATPRFVALLATNAMNWKVPLTMFGGLDTATVDGKQVLDFKLNGTALVVDFARIYALANNITVRNTRERLEAISRLPRFGQTKAEDWVSTFEFLQTMRLKAQIDSEGQNTNPNALDTAKLSSVDKVILKAAFNISKTMQQRLKLDYVR